MSFRTVPFVRLFLPLALGVIGGEWLGRPLANWPLAVLGIGLILLIAATRMYAYRWRWVFGSVACAALFGLGWLRTANYPEYLATDHFSLYPTARYFTGVIDEAPEPGNWWKITVKMETAGIHRDTLLPVSGRLILFYQPDSLSDTLHYGDQLAFQGRFSPCEGPKNPHSFDYRWYLHTRDLHFQLFARADSVFRLAEGGGSWFWRTAFTCRDRILRRLHLYFASPDEYAVACALLLGYQADLSDEVRTIYVETGSMHALAVSGTHVGMVYAGLLLLLRRLPLKGRWARWFQTVSVLSGIWAFTLVTGASASVLRAALMFSLFLLGQALFRRASVWNVLAASATLLVLYRPYFLFDAGCQLSYCAVAGMVFFFPRLYRISPIFPGWIDAGWQVLLVGIAAQLGTLPLSLYYFHQFPVYFWLAGWVVVLGGAIFLWGGAALVLIDALWPAAAFFPGKGLFYLVKIMNTTVGLIQQLPASIWGGLWTEKIGAGLVLGSLITLAIAWSRRSSLWLLLTLVLLAGTGLWRGTRSYHRLFHREITVYSVHKNRLVDLFDGEKVITLADTSLSARQEKFAAECHRIALGMRHREKRTFSDQFISFGGHTIAILDDDALLHNLSSPQPVDILILSKNVRASLAQCTAVLPARFIVADGTNSNKKLRSWQAEAYQLHLPFHNTRSQGAFVLPLNKDF